MSVFVSIVKSEVATRKNYEVVMCFDEVIVKSFVPVFQTSNIVYAKNTQAKEADHHTRITSENRISF